MKVVGPDLGEDATLEYLDSLNANIANQLVSALTAYKPRFVSHIARYRDVAKQQRLDQAQKSTEVQRDNWTSVDSIKRAVRLMRNSNDKRIREDPTAFAELDSVEHGLAITVLLLR